MTSHTRRALRVAALPALLALAIAPAAAQAERGPILRPQGTLSLVAVDSGGQQATAASHVVGTTTVASAGGRYVVFSTSAALVPRDRNRTDDVYRRDTVRGRTVLVSVRKDGTQGDDYSHEPSISASGRFVAFTTWSDALVPGDDNGTLDVLVKDLRTGALELVSRSTGGEQSSRHSFSPVISGDGRHVAFQTFGRFARADADVREDVYVHHRRSGRTEQVSLGVRGDDVRRSVLVGGISHDGSRVTFGNDHDAWVRDDATDRTVRVWHEENHPSQPGPMGTLGRPMISGDGRYVVLSTRADVPGDDDPAALSDIVRVEVETGDTLLVSVAADGTAADGESFGPSISRTGRFVGFTSYASTVVDGDDNGVVDVFRSDLRTGEVVLASWGPGGPGSRPSGSANAASVSPDGGHVVFETYADDLVAGHAHPGRDVLVWSAPS